MEKTFKVFLGVSIIGHIAVLILLNIDSLWVSENDLIIQNAIKVDVVGLPEKKKPKPALPRKKPKPKPQPKKTAKKPKPKPKPKADKKAQESAFERLDRLAKEEALKKKQQEALKKLEQQTQKEEPEETPAEPEQPVAGNIITMGTALKGLDKIQMERYFGQVQQHIQSQFQIPSFLNNAQLSGQADIKIDGRGFVIFRGISKTSGNDIFDNAILTAIDNSSPLPEPPPRLQSRLENAGFRLGFPE